MERSCYGYPRNVHRSLALAVKTFDPQHTLECDELYTCSDCLAQCIQTSSYNMFVLTLMRIVGNLSFVLFGS